MKRLAFITAALLPALLLAAACGGGGGGMAPGGNFDCDPAPDYAGTYNISVSGSCSNSLGAKASISDCDSAKAVQSGFNLTITATINGESATINGKVDCDGVFSATGTENTVEGDSCIVSTFTMSGSLESGKGSWSVRNEQRAASCSGSASYWEQCSGTWSLVSKCGSKTDSGILTPLAPGGMAGP